MNKQDLQSFGSVIQGSSYKRFQKMVVTAFPDEAAFSNWIYADGANMFSYIHSIDYKDSVENVGRILETVFHANNLKEDLEFIKKDKSAYKFIAKWLKNSGRPERLQSSLAKISSGKRNLYSLLLCILLNHTREAQALS